MTTCPYCQRPKALSETCSGCGAPPMTAVKPQHAPDLCATSNVQITSFLAGTLVTTDIEIIGVGSGTVRFARTEPRKPTQERML